MSISVECYWQGDANMRARTRAAAHILEESAQRDAARPSATCRASESVLVACVFIFDLVYM